MPEAGGINDQPAGMLAKMIYLNNIYTATKSYYSASNTAEWADHNPDAWETYAAARVLEKKRVN